MKLEDINAIKLRAFTVYQVNSYHSHKVSTAVCVPSVDDAGGVNSKSC